jgi:hypothetical protein
VDNAKEIPGFRLDYLEISVELLQRENQGKVQDLTSLDSLLGKHMYDLLEATPGTAGAWWLLYLSSTGSSPRV